MNVISDTLIALAYMTIPITLVYFIRKRRDIPFDWMFGAFGIFILACGSTHVMEIWTIWHPAYWLSALIKVITAVASCITAILLIKLIPAALLIPSPQQLAKVNEELRKTQAKLVSTARQAGMAEIATNVLHNVGNVLNSVNISAELVSSQVRGSKAQGLGKVAHLMNEHVDDLSDFLTRDQKGKMLPDYLLRLAEVVTAEQQGIIEELEQLTRGINHIKDIVAAQQSYAGTSSVFEPVLVKDLVEEAVKMSASSLSHHQVTVVKELADVPMLSIDKRRVLEILINLISNAKQAMGGVPGRQYQITLRLHWEQGHMVKIQVADNGEGIAPENLTRIFSHGFTTRKDGHGFGLHSCVIAAREMGGSLTAHSEGVGKGATFTLELPIKVTEEAALL
jgi:signal transduction histidine kinase